MKESGRLWMVRMVLKNWKSEWKLYWKESGNNAIPCLIAAFVYGGMAYTASESKVTSFCLGMMFLFLGLREIYPNRLPKWMFVIPMSEKEKRQYLYTKFGVKMGIAFLIGIVMCMFSYQNGRAVVNQISVMPTWMMFSVFVGIENQKMDKKEIFIKIEEFLCIFAFIVEQLLLEVAEIWSNIAIIVIVFLVTCINVIGIHKNWEKAFGTAMDYELWNIKETKGSRNL